MKKYIAVLLALTLCLTLFACGEEKTNDPTQAPAAATPTEAPEATEEPTPSPAPTANPFVAGLTSAEGYNVNLEEMTFAEEESYEIVAVADIKDDAAKQALKDAGHADTDKVLHLISTSNVNNASFCGDWKSFLCIDYDDVYSDFYLAGNEYDITLEYYANGNGGYLIELDGTSGNHALIGPGLIKAGYNKSVSNFKVNGNGFNMTFYQVPADTYVASMNFKQIVHEKKFSYTIDEMKTKEINADTLLDYTYDFAEGNVPDLGNNGDYIKIADADDALKAKLSADNGFKDYAFHNPNAQFGFFFTNENFKANTKYTFSMRIYSETDLTTYEPDVTTYFAHILPLNMLTDYGTSGHQLSGDNGYKDQVNFTATPVEGKPNVYDITGSIVCTDDSILYSAMMYNNKAAKNIYVASITIKGESI